MGSCDGTPWRVRRSARLSYSSRDHEDDDGDHEDDDGRDSDDEVGGGGDGLGQPLDLADDYFPVFFMRALAEAPPETAAAMLSQARFGQWKPPPQQQQPSESPPHETGLDNASVGIRAQQPSSQSEGVDFLSFDAITAKLEEIYIRSTDGRDNVRRSSDQVIRSICTGASPARKAGGIQVAEASRCRPNLTRLLVALGRATIPDVSFRFNAIQINKDFATAM